ncbi:hypothetical protein [Deinococcus sp. PEB2-63]
MATQILKDEATLQPGKDKRDVQTTFSGSYSTARDPRINTEANRKLATGTLHLMPGEVPFEAVISANIAYNTLLSHIEAVAADRRSVQATVRGHPEQCWPTAARSGRRQSCQPAQARP